MITAVAVVLLLVGGLFLSAFFSGAETGFYRANRVRLVLDSRGGDYVARGLLWLTNNPTLFVATTLIGNNLANYLTSLSIVLGARLVTDIEVVELLAPVALSPLLFVYGELLPKNLFFRAPNMLLRRAGPLLLFCAALFAPVSALLWTLALLLQGVVGQTPLRVQRRLARKELRQVLLEGQEVGILRPAQRGLAQNLVSVSPRPVRSFSKPIARVASVRQGAKKSEVLRMARRHRAAVIPVTGRAGRKLIGYVRIIDVYFDTAETIESVRPLVAVAEHESYVSAIQRMRSQDAALACVYSKAREPVGLLFTDQLVDSLFREE